ncbi:MAG: hypothetical protein V7634_2079 [Bradyrhizobium sp.]
MAAARWRASILARRAHFNYTQIRQTPFDRPGRRSGAIAEASAKIARSALLLPRYTRRKRLKKGGLVISSTCQRGRAKEVARSRMNRLVLTMSSHCSARQGYCCLAFDSWLRGGEDAPGRRRSGCRNTRLDFSRISSDVETENCETIASLKPRECPVHETGIKMICEYVLKDGRRLGTRRVTSIDTAFPDDLFEKLLYKDVDGEKVERRTTVNHAMKTAAAHGTRSREPILTCFRQKPV